MELCIYFWKYFPAYSYVNWHLYNKPQITSPLLSYNLLAYIFLLKIMVRSSKPWSLLFKISRLRPKLSSFYEGFSEPTFSSHFRPSYISAPNLPFVFWISKQDKNRGWGGQLRIKRGRVKVSVNLTGVGRPFILILIFQHTNQLFFGWAVHKECHHNFENCKFSKFSICNLHVLLIIIYSPKMANDQHTKIEVFPNLS